MVRGGIDTQDGVEAGKLGLESANLIGSACLVLKLVHHDPPLGAKNAALTLDGSEVGVRVGANCFDEDLQAQHFTLGALHRGEDVAALFIRRRRPLALDQGENNQPLQDNGQDGDGEE